LRKKKEKEAENCALSQIYDTTRRKAALIRVITLNAHRKLPFHVDFWISRKRKRIVLSLPKLRAFVV